MNSAAIFELSMGPLFGCIILRCVGEPCPYALAQFCRGSLVQCEIAVMRAQIIVRAGRAAVAIDMELKGVIATESSSVFDFAATGRRDDPVPAVFQLAAWIAAGASSPAGLRQFRSW